MKKKKKIKIGLTMGSLGRIWSNGLDQNVVFLAKILKKSGFDPSLIIVEDKFSKEKKEYKGIKLVRYDKNIYKTLSKFDAIFFVSNFTGEETVKKLKDKGVKIVMVTYGNGFGIFNEAAATNPEKMDFDFTRYRHADALWLSPHYERNIPWYKSFCPAEISVCPYVWHPLFFDAKVKEFKKDPMWTPEKNVKSIAIHEPNINAQKTCILPLAIVGELNRTNPELVDRVVVLNAKQMKENKSFINYVNSLGLVKKGSFESRRTTPFMACEGVMGLSLFHHIFNGLNYLPMELMRLGYPVVHNSDFFKSAGYYYPGIDAMKGAEQLKLAIETHEENYEKQLEAGKEIIYKYSMDNPVQVEGYKRLIEKLFDS
jgi:hypothetical protein